MPSATRSDRTRPARLWHLATAVVAGFALGVQLFSNIVEAPGRGFAPDPDAYGSPLQRTITWLSFFTTQSNILVLVAAVLLAAQTRPFDSRMALLRLSRLVGISITFVVNLVVLRPITADLYSGIWVVTDFLLHYLTPVMAVGGWLWFEPRPSMRWRTFQGFLIWPSVWLAYTFVRGAMIGWYPYPFLDAGQLGYPKALTATAVVLLVGVAAAAGFVALDRGLAARTLQGAD